MPLFGQACSVPKLQCPRSSGQCLSDSQNIVYLCLYTNAPTFHAHPQLRVGSWANRHTLKLTQIGRIPTIAKTIMPSIKMPKSKNLLSKKKKYPSIPAFIAELPHGPTYCSLCHERYGSGTHQEKALRLPCGDEVGDVCLLVSLSLYLDLIYLIPWELHFHVLVD